MGRRKKHDLPYSAEQIEEFHGDPADGIVTADGQLRKDDTIVMATGFATTKFLTVIKVTGRDALALTDAWSEGPQAYFGISIAGFPKLFMVYGPNVNNGTILYVIEEQVKHIMLQRERMKTEQLRTLEVRKEVMIDYNERLQEDIQNVEVWQAGCDGYYRLPTGRIVTQWPHNMTDFSVAFGKAPADAYAGAS